MTAHPHESHKGGLSLAAASLRRSFDVYYRDHARTARMDALNARLVRPGDLVFDIGAHLGDRTGSFLRIGARVVAVEPQPRMARALRLLYGRRADFALCEAAVGEVPGRETLYLNARNPTVATNSSAFVAAAANAPGWRDQVWDGRVEVEVVTLDTLIAAHGTPAFVKIDVEGREDAALAGLSCALPALSFEMTTIQREVAVRCLNRLDGLARYRFNLSLGEEHRLRSPAWLDAPDMMRMIAALPDDANSGDVIARRV
ncbi:FkbM family methyltransferase [Jannaschia aquimarina]|uniref:Methyltransferase FkbM domain-containing protein n=1 Tax=Jannaschia aquimarina TaxID=935700 RepID=A0A0D1D3V7_9RHOB|nr:FkbM family methyltransferase [Jannaschia aquimarina]KIT14778.1 hypothetical protein jaqu_34940 [Jannaschia aquimarina]SNT43885.1 methyltransferase, FkbM family [Jannaschia aquimarina]